MQKEYYKLRAKEKKALSEYFFAQLLAYSKKVVISDSATMFPPKLRSQNPANGKIK